MHTLDTRTRGILWDINAAIAFTFLTALVKFAGQELPSPMIAFVRTCAGMVFVIPLALRQGLAWPKKKAWKWYVLRTIVGTVTINAVFYAYSHLPLSVATVVGYTEPMMQMVVSMICFGATITPLQWALMLVGYGGVFLIAYTKYDPDSEVATVALCVALLASLLISLLKAITKHLTREEPTHQVIFYSGWLNMVSTFTFACGASSFLTVMPSSSVWMALPVIGFLGFLTQYSLTKALSLTDMHVLAPIAYLRLIFALPIGYYLYGEVPTWPVLLGSGIIVGANYCLLRARAV